MACHSMLCSSIILSVLIKSMQLWCLQNPACSFQSCCSPVFCIVFKITPVRILLGIIKRVIPLQLLQFDRSFFSILIISLSSHSSGIFSSFHIFFNRGYSISTVISGQLLVLLDSYHLDQLRSHFLTVSGLAVFQFFRRVQVYFGFIFIFNIIVFNISHFLLTFCFIILLVEHFGKMFFAICSIVLLVLLRVFLI